MEHKAIHDLVDTFLAERRKSEGGWAEITNDDIQQLEKIVLSLVKAKCQADPDGDYPIQFRIVNRRTHEHLSFQAVPYLEDIPYHYGPKADGFPRVKDYDYPKNLYDIARVVWMNRQIAETAADHVWRMFEQYHYEANKANETPSPESVKRTP
jgi:hypothetical protein